MSKKEDLSLEEIKKGAGLAALSYVFFLWILAFLIKKDNRFTHYHARHGLVIFIGEVIFAVLSLIPLIGGIFYVLGIIIFSDLSLYGIYSALTGRLCRIPIVTDIAEKLVI